MIDTDANHGQHERWSGPEGDHWVRNADRHDRVLAPFADRLAAVAGIEPGNRVLDIGCGCGATTVTAATAVGPNGRVLGVDLSPQMLDVARARAQLAGVAGHASFEVADAQVADLGAGSWDVAVSRFGIMFFDEPVAAFTNIASALVPGGSLAFTCWQELAANDWLLVPGAAAAAHVALPEGLDGDQPGPFSLADPERLRAVLREAGFATVVIHGFETTVLLAGGGSLDDTMDYLEGSGFGRELLAGIDETTRTSAIAAVREALAPFHDGEGVRLGAAAWIVSAHRGFG